MCPHEIFQAKGYHLEDYFGEEWERRYLDCVQDARISKRTVTLKDIIRLVLRSAAETGTPFTFNRDTVNRMNPNGHAGMIYCSNLCTEIAQNMQAIEEVSKEVQTTDGDTVVVTVTRPGEFVVCNLASLSLGHLPVTDTSYMEEIVSTAVRALDNVIDLNFYPTPYAKLTNQKYRSIGLGVSGYHHMLAKHGIIWESEEHLKFADTVFETINYAAILASTNLAEEKEVILFLMEVTGKAAPTLKKRLSFRKMACPAKKGCHTGHEKCVSARRCTYQQHQYHLRDDCRTRSYPETFISGREKGSMLPRVAPELSPATYWYYKRPSDRSDLQHSCLRSAPKAH